MTTDNDDGGFSGGSMKRPGLQKLLADIDAGRIDVVVVYKVDRLTRSLLDFAHIVQRLEDKGVSFVSVTQSFNTTSSMGRLTLNVLLSFAQFEREVTGERIRDKIAASKKKGIWMGGPVPLGYDLRDRKLYVNRQEAKTVRWLFETYLELGNVRQLKQAVDKAGLSSKRYTQRNGRTVGGHPFSRGQLYCLLKNPLYAGKIRHKGKIYEGQHDAIIDPEAWGRVQDLLKANGGIRNAETNTPSPSWLSGLLHDDNGERMVATQSTKAGRVYRYYVSASLMTRKADPDRGWRLPAREIERILANGIKDLLNDPVKVLDVLNIEPVTANLLQRVTGTSKALVRKMDAAGLETIGPLIRPLLRNVGVSLYEVVIELNRSELCRVLRIEVDGTGPTSDGNENCHTITLPVQLKRRGVEMRIVVPAQVSETPEVDKELQKLVARTYCWFDRIKDGQTASDIARSENIDIGDVSRTLPLAFLAPDIVEDILNGRHPIDLTPQKLKRLPNLPLEWQEQRRILGFA